MFSFHDEFLWFGRIFPQLCNDLCVNLLVTLYGTKSEYSNIPQSTKLLRNGNTVPLVSIVHILRTKLMDGKFSIIFFWIPLSKGVEELIFLHHDETNL